MSAAHLPAEAGHSTLTQCGDYYLLDGEKKQKTICSCQRRKKIHFRQQTNQFAEDEQKQDGGNEASAFPIYSSPFKDDYFPLGVFSLSLFLSSSFTVNSFGMCQIMIKHLHLLSILHNTIHTIGLQNWPSL